MSPTDRVPIPSTSTRASASASATNPTSATNPAHHPASAPGSAAPAPAPAPAPASAPPPIHHAAGAPAALGLGAATAAHLGATPFTSPSTTEAALTRTASAPAASDPTPHQQLSQPHSYSHPHSQPHSRHHSNPQPPNLHVPSTWSAINTAPPSAVPGTTITSPHHHATLSSATSRSATTIHTNPDVDHQHDLETQIRQLLDQQAEIQSRLATLFSAHYGFDPSLELEMLRHKCRVLEDVVQHYNNQYRTCRCLSSISVTKGFNCDFKSTDILVANLSRIPTLSEIEEARALQYRCECLEVACLQDCESSSKLLHCLDS